MSLHTYTYVGMFTGPWVHMCACVQKNLRLILHHSSTLLIESRPLSQTQSWPLWLVSPDILFQNSVSTFWSWNYSWATMHLAWCGLWRSNLWSYRLHDKCFTHWANTPLLPRPLSWFLKCLKPLDTDNGVIWGIVWTGLDQFYASRFNLPNEACTLCGAVCQMGIWQ